MELSKIVYVLLACLMLAMPAVAVQEAGEIDDSQCTPRNQMAQERVRTRFEFFGARGEIVRIRMEAVMAYAESKGYDTAELAEIKDSFVSVMDEAGQAMEEDDDSKLKELAEEGKALVDDFRDKAREIIPENERDEAVAAADEAEEENSQEIDDKIDSAIQNRKKHFLNVFDARVCVHQRMIDRLEGRELDVAALQEEIDAISVKRADLEQKQDAAFESCRPTAVMACTNEDADALRDLVAEINEDFRNLRQSIKDFTKSRITARIAERLEGFAEKAKGNLERLRQNGADTTAAQAKLDEIDDMIEDLSQSLEEDAEVDIKKSAKSIGDSLKGVHSEIVDTMKDLRENARNSRGGGR